jgi:hypothetical protein
MTWRNFAEYPKAPAAKKHPKSKYSLAFKLKAINFGEKNII